MTDKTFFKIREPREISLPFTEHLRDLRKCLLFSVSAVALFGIAAFHFIDRIIDHFSYPVGKFYFSSPAEGFSAKLKVSLLAGVFLASPVVFFQLWSFIQRGLRKKEKALILSMTLISFLLFVSGILFCYFLILPLSVSFLLAYSTKNMLPMISVSRYISFAGGMMFSFGIIFETPVVFWFLSKSGLIGAATLSKNRRLAIVLIFIASAVLTPSSDALNQLLMAGPLIALYEAGVLAARISERRK